MNQDELELFASSVSAATARYSGAALDGALAELGWLDALEADPAAAVATVLGHQGASNTTSSALTRVLAYGLGADPAAVTAVLPPLGAVLPPGTVAGDRVEVRGVAFGAPPAGSTVVVAAQDGGDVVAVDVAADELACTPVSGIDPRAELVELFGSAPAPGRRRADWDTALASTQLAAGHELLGAARRMLELAREHALERVQFGQPIAMFQAVRHRMADALVAIESADALLGAAWIDRSTHTAGMAKALAGRSARTTTRHCQQVLAGIGFTTEHDFHRYLRRVLLLDQVCGASPALTRALGVELLGTRQLPALLPL